MLDSLMDEDGPSFVPNADIDEAATTRIRAPADEQPYDSDDDTSFCFASRFTPGDDDDPSDLGAGQLKDSFRNMHALIDRYLNNNTSMTDLVGAVYEFYNSQIRAMHDYGEWTKKSIYRYIMHYSSSSEDRQASESIKIVWASIELLRAQVAVRDDATSKVTPDLRIVKALGDAIKLHASLVDARRKRPKTTT